MNVLNDQRELPLSSIPASRLTHSTSRRIRPHRFVVTPSIVVASETKPSGRPENEQGRRERQQYGPPGGLRSKPTVWRTAKNFRGIEWRKVIAKIIVVTLEGCPRCINNEARQTERYKKRLDPPQIAPGCRT